MCREYRPRNPEEEYTPPTVTVAVLPEVEDVEVEINQNDLRIDVFRAGAPAVSALIQRTPQCG